MHALHHRSLEHWETRGGKDTACEIAQQPELWRQLPAVWASLGSDIRAQLCGLLSHPQAQVLLTGAGTSAYVGELAAPALNAAWPAQIQAIATTTLLSHPALYLRADAPLLLVSFARSGNSPESQAVVDLTRQLVPHAYFLNISCNSSGQLALRAMADARSYNLILPPASCDQGFAMTSSFTCMLLTALAVLGRADAATCTDYITQLADMAQRDLDKQSGYWYDWGQTRVERIVYLGAGPLQALAREAALKTLELSGGRILAMAETPLGFRHGPKSVLDQRTLVIMFRSQDCYVRQYEEDLLLELRRDRIAASLVCIDGRVLGAAPDLPDAWLAAVYIVSAQILALHQSVRLGLTPDNPFPDGSVNRVVQGVRIHAYA